MIIVNIILILICCLIITHDDDLDDDLLEYFWLFPSRSASQTILIVACEKDINRYDVDCDEDYQ